MDNLQEDNPLQTQSEIIATRVAIKLKNNVGRPKKKTEIKFSPQPKSIISEFLCNERKHLLENPTYDISSKTSVEEKNKGTCEEFSDGNIYSTSDYNEHILMHTNKLYKCDYENCTYVTKFSSNLTTHKRIHTSERPYACDECTFRTNFINSLKSHKRLHRAELPFACKYCKYKCNSGSNLKKHCIRKHSDILKK